MLRKGLHILTAVIFILVFSLGFNFFRLFSHNGHSNHALAHIIKVSALWVGRTQSSQFMPTRRSLISVVEENEEIQQINRKAASLPLNLDNNTHNLALLFLQLFHTQDAPGQSFATSADIHPQAHAEPLFVRYCNFLI